MPTAVPWPAADVVFRTDPAWLGGDDAYSVALGGDRTVWLFGDTFLGEAGAGRARASFVANSLAVQQGLDPTRAAMVRRPGGPGQPEPFPGTGDEWLWPLDGVRAGRGVMLFFMRVRSTRPDLPRDEAWATEGSLGFFDVVGWTARRVPDTSGPPAEWVVEPARVPDGGPDCVLGTAVLREGGWTYAYGYRDDRTALLARWRDDAVDGGDLVAPEWWCGAGGWSRSATPEPVLDSVPTEFTVHRHHDGRLLLVQIGDPLRPVLQLRRADAPEGPWEPLVPAGQPPEASQDGVLCYAAKAHPELVGPGVAVTYATIALTRERTLADEGLYFPRFLQVDV